MALYLAFLLLSIFWGSSYLWIRVAVAHVSPLALVSMRLVVGAVVILGLATLRRQTIRVSRRQMILLIVLGTINTTIPFLLISWGEVSVSSGLASVLNSTVPIFTVLIAAVILRDEPITVARLGGVVVGFIGVIVLLSHDLNQGAARWSGAAGQGAIILSSICYASGAVYIRRLLRDIKPMTIAVWAVCVSAVETSLLSLIFSPPPFSSLQPSAVVAAVWLGALGTGLAYGLAYYILDNWGASRYTLIAYTLPITGLSLGAIFLKEVLDWRTLVGSLLVILGIILASLARRRPVSETTVTKGSRHVPAEQLAPTGES